MDFKPSPHRQVIVRFWPNVFREVVAGHNYSSWSDDHCVSLALDWRWIVVCPLEKVCTEYTVFLGEVINDYIRLSCVSIPPLVRELGKGTRAKSACMAGFAGT